MLIETKFKEGDVVTLKLLGGDEVVAKLVKVEDLVYTIKYPLIVMMAQNGFGMIPFMVTVEHSATHEIEMRNVVSIQKTHTEVSKQYIKQTTGLVV